jgi:bifunctional N-acetylglucosamine-1-phosphate-uridyltransferase/glucosamine-1-phosphate-acetyltransferase GlmU-like protein
MDHNKATPNIIITAAEITKGMKSVGSKSLLRLKNSIPIIEHQIISLRKFYPKSQIYISTGFESDKIHKIVQQYGGIEIVYNQDYRNTNQGKGIVQCLDACDIDSALILNSGIMFKHNFAINKQSSIIYLLSKSKKDFDIGCHDTTNVDYLFYDLPQKWSECAYLSHSAIHRLKNLREKQTMDQLYLFELINLLIDSGENFYGSVIPKQKLMKVTGLKDLPRAKAFI